MDPNTDLRSSILNPQSSILDFSLRPGFLRRPPPGKLNYCQTNLATRALNLWV